MLVLNRRHCAHSECIELGEWVKNIKTPGMVVARDPVVSKGLQAPHLKAPNLDNPIPIPEGPNQDNPNRGIVDLYLHVHLPRIRDSSCQLHTF